MRRRLLLSLVCFCCVFFCLTISAAAAQPGAEFDGYLVKIDTADITAKYEAALSAFSQCMETGASSYVHVETAEELQYIRSLGISCSVEPNYFLHMCASTQENLTSFNAVHQNTIHADALSSRCLFGQDLDSDTDIDGDGNSTEPIVIAVIDSGVTQQHEDIDYAHVYSTVDFTGTGTTDTLGHGTFITGQILATYENEIGINGLAPQAYVLPLKVFSNKTTSNFLVAQAIQYATEERRTYLSSHGSAGSNVCVINLSLGGEDGSSLLKNAIEEAIQQGIIVVCSAGNDGNTLPSYPAQYAIGVGSSDDDGGLDRYAGTYTQVISSSNGTGYLNKVWVSAPGTSYCSIDTDGSYIIGSGTSFSAPQVSALAAICVSLHNSLTDCLEAGQTVDNGSGCPIAVTNNHLAFKLLLKETSDLEHYSSMATTYFRTPLLPNGQDIRYGWGMLDCAAILAYLQYQEDQHSMTQMAVTVQDILGASIANAEVSVFALSDGGTLGEEISPDENGVYRLDRGSSYLCRVHAAGFVDYEEEITASTPSLSLSVTLIPAGDLALVQFSPDGAPADDFTVSLINEGNGQEISPYADQIWALPAGTYTYTATSPRWVAATGTFTILPEQYGSLVPLSFSAVSGAEIRFAILPAQAAQTAVSTVKKGGQICIPYRAGRYVLSAGYYNYTVTAENYCVAAGGFTVAERGKEIAVTLEKAPTITLSASELTVGMKKSLTLQADIGDAPKDTTVYWASSNPAVATVSKGKITGKAQGSCVISATTTTGATASCHITVVQPITSLKLPSTKLSLAIGQSTSMELVLGDKTGCAVTDCVLSYDSSVLHAALDDHTLFLSAVGSGNAKTSLTVLDQVSGKKVTCTVTVGPGATRVTASGGLVDYTLNMGSSKTLKATAATDDAGVKPLSTTVQWESSDPTVATVSSKGSVKAVGVGTCTIRAIPVCAASDDVHLDYTVTVVPVMKSFALYDPVTGANLKKLEIQVNDTVALSQFITESSAQWSKGQPLELPGYAVQYSTTSRTITLDEETGSLTAIGAGSAKVKVMAVCGSTKKTVTLSITIRNV